MSVRNLFVVTGPPGSGKTPILCELERLGFRSVNEPAREIIAERAQDARRITRN